MTRRRFPLAALGALSACSAPQPEPEARKMQPEPPPAPPDESRRFPRQGQTAFEIVSGNLLGKDYLPGGNLAFYEKDGKRHQQFLIVTRSPDDAAVLTFDIKGNLEGAKYVPHFGGYFGHDGELPLFVFPKGRYVAGVAGLPQEQADAVARDFAARLD